MIMNHREKEGQSLDHGIRLRHIVGFALVLFVVVVYVSWTFIARMTL